MCSLVRDDPWFVIFWKNSKTAKETPTFVAMIFFWMSNYIRVDFIIGQSNKAHYSDFFCSWKNLPFFQRFHDAGEIQKCDRTFITGTAHGCIWCFYSFTNSLGTLETPTTIFRRHFSNTEKITNQGTFCAIRNVSILTTYYLLEDQTVVCMGLYSYDLTHNKPWTGPGMKPILYMTFNRHTLNKAKKNHEPGSTYAQDPKIQKIQIFT